MIEKRHTILCLRQRSPTDQKNTWLQLHSITSKYGISLLIYSQAQVDVDIIFGMEDMSTKAYQEIRGFMTVTRAVS